MAERWEGRKRLIGGAAWPRITGGHPQLLQLVPFPGLGKLFRIFCLCPFVVHLRRNSLATGSSSKSTSIKVCRGLTRYMQREDLLMVLVTL